MTDSPPPTLGYAPAGSRRRRTVRMILLVALVLVAIVFLAVCAYVLYVLTRPDVFKGMIG